MYLSISLFVSFYVDWSLCCVCVCAHLSVCLPGGQLLFGVLVCVSLLAVDVFICLPVHLCVTQLQLSLI